MSTTIEKVGDIAIKIGAVIAVSLGTAVLTKSIFEKKIDEKVSAKTNELIDDAATKQSIKELAIAAAGKITSEDIRDAVKKAAETCVENKARDIIEDVVKSISKDDIRDRVKASLEDIDMKHIAEKAVADKAESYVSSNADKVMTKVITRSVEDKLTSIANIAGATRRLDYRW